MKSLLCAVVFVLGLLASASAQTAPPPPVIERQVIVQGSVGRPGREVAFLLVQNLEDEPTDVTIEVVTAGQLALRTYQLGPKERRAVNVGLEVPELGGSAFFSVVVYFPRDTAGAAEMVWHRASDFTEVDSQVAVIRRSTKR